MSRHAFQRSVGVLAASSAAASLLAAATPQALAQNQPPTPVVVSKVLQQDVRDGQTYTATVQPSKRATIGSAVDGRVIDFPVNAGDRVGAGATLATLLTETIVLEIEAADAELILRTETLKELQNGARPEEVEEALARMEAAKAAQDYAEAKYDRVLKAFQSGRAATKEELDEAKSAMQGARETFKQYSAAYKLVQKGPRAERIAQAAAQVDMQDAVVRRLRDQEKKHTIVSRFAGYVVAEHTEVGQWVNRGDAVAEVVALDEVHVTASVLESHVAHVREGSEVRVEVAAVPDRVFTGQVAYVVPQGDLRARTFPVVVSVKNEITDEGPLLKSGMLARVALATGTVQQATLVPKDAIVLGGQTPMVYVVEGGAVRAVPVQLGVASGGLIEAKGELKAGESVVVRGNERLRPGITVRVVEELAAAPAADSASEAPKDVSSAPGAAAP